MKFLEPATVHTAQGSQPISLRQAKGPFSRFCGLMLTKPLLTQPQPQALLITRCPSVHGFFMRYTLDIAYLATEGVNQYSVTHTTTLKPWRISFGRKHTITTPTGVSSKHSAHALELPAGSIKQLGIVPGDTLEVHA